jgi:phenylacetic acid degradation protein paaN
MTLSDLVIRHRETLDHAVRANAERTFHAHWPEPPSGKIYGETANEDGLKAFQSQVNMPFNSLLQSGAHGSATEDSPYGFPLGITYPQSSVEELISRASAAQVSWQTLSPLERASVLIEALERASKRFFEIGYATMHTTGQGFVMAFQSSGPHGFDRALEALALGYAAQTGFTDDVLWSKPMGKFDVSIQKTYRIVPKGVNLVIGCSTFPVWNSTPGMFAGLVTGNSVIVKPHPGAIYPIAIVVAEIQHTLQDAGLDPHLCQLATDTIQQPITLDMLKHPAVRVVDYTGGPHFGKIVEQEGAAGGKVVFTEKAGVNSVIIDSADDLDAALNNLAFSLTLYAGQMCTAPQNIYIPVSGVRSGDATFTFDEVAAKLKEHVDALVGNPKAGAGTVGTIQNAATLARLEEARSLGLTVIRDSDGVTHQGFDSARTASPLILKADPSNEDVYRREWFGPISFVIATDSFDEAVTLVAKGVREQGALTTLIYTTDEQKMQRAENAIVSAGAPVAFNFNSFVWVNQSAAFSDFHGAGANPAGNASFADWSFVTNRYNVIGVRKQVLQGA